MESEFFIASTAIIFSLGVLPGSILYFIHRVAAKKLDTIVRLSRQNLRQGSCDIVIPLKARCKALCC